MQGSRDGFVKLFCRSVTGIVIGGVVVAPRASELIYPIAVAVAQRLTVDQVSGVVHRLSVDDRLDRRGGPPAARVPLDQLTQVASGRERERADRRGDGGRPAPRPHLGRADRRRDVDRLRDPGLPRADVDPRDPDAVRRVRRARPRRNGATGPGPTSAGGGSATPSPTPGTARWSASKPPGLRGVITQNVDGLHAAAGSQQVINLHGEIATVICLDCGRQRAATRRCRTGWPSSTPSWTSRPSWSTPSCGRTATPWCGTGTTSSSRTARRAAAG